ncbi:MAG TPA: hypothetical protein PLA74_09105 [Syntrophales bacterium]|nr:hypothetical protein [Syntrophales bacterium]HPQ42969.1 hypothetical protein [Syntrophales bacterium]
MKSPAVPSISFIVALTDFPPNTAEATELSGRGNIPHNILILNSPRHGYAWFGNEKTGTVDVVQIKDKNRIHVVADLNINATTFTIFYEIILYKSPIFCASAHTVHCAQHSLAPIYSTYEQRPCFSVACFKLMSARLNRADTASIILKVFDSEKASVIPVF